MKGIKKVCNKLKVTEREKSSIPSKNTIDFDKDNVRFQSYFQIANNCGIKERELYKKYTDKDQQNIDNCASKNVPVAAVQKLCPKFSN